MKLELIDDHMCYVCGKKNKSGFRLDFKHPAKDRLTAEIAFSKEHQGFKDIVHGGIVSMLLDEIMVNLAWTEGIPAVTAELVVRLKKAIKVGERVFLEGKIEERRGKLIYASASAKNAQGETLATAQGSCFRINKR